ncbi:hypothetical protein Hrd1104_11145 [Halorhabdus sp. CBA1104]|uniref:hypothetical protein n=1 Tax=Halorhabdus sp. CBA1104 TaxID=1380432 RepID=UPI0012B404B4|nr:hypothetical protein [Halorhabdus sp. CBA1104]QGN07801.1 hypothetical protein Hrd1104_11145 [Halorhabdus sp. CBA1104]
MKRRDLLAVLGGVVGSALAGCTEGSEDTATSSAGPTADVPTVGNITVPDPANVTVETVTVEDVTVEEPTDVATAPDVAFCPDHDDIDVVNHSLAATTDEIYYVEGTVRNEGSDSTCSFVLLDIEYPNDRRETDAMFVGNLDPAETGAFSLGPLNLSDADPESVGYKIYVSNESWDE